MNDRAPPGNPELFEWFRAAAPTFTPAHFVKQLSAIVELYHPKAPDPWPTYRFICQLHPRALDSIAKQSNLNHLGHKIMRTMFLLQLEGVVTEASKLESRVRKRFKLVWRRRDQVMRQSREDPKLKHLLSASPHIAIESLENSDPKELFAAKLPLASRKTDAPVPPARTPSRSYSTGVSRSGSHVELSLAKVTVSQVEELFASSRRRWRA